MTIEEFFNGNQDADEMDVISPPNLPMVSVIGPETMEHLKVMLQAVFADGSIFSLLNAELKNEVKSYPQDQSWSEIRKPKSSGANGNINSSICDKWTAVILKRLAELYPDEVTPIDGHHLDGRMKYDGKNIDFDAKAGIVNTTEAGEWLVNETSWNGLKGKILVLFKFRLDETCPLSQIRIMGFCVGITLPETVVYHYSKSKTGGDRGSIKISNDQFDALVMVCGTKEKKDKWVKLELIPTPDDDITPADKIHMRAIGWKPNSIYPENCLLTMARMGDDTVDLTVTSPPYDDLRTYNGYSFPFEIIAKELYRVTKPGGIVVWVVNDAVDTNGSETLSSFKQAVFFKDVCGFIVHDTMFYKKSAPRYPERKRYGQVVEYMFVLAKGQPKTINMIKDRPNRWAGYCNWGKHSQRDDTGNLVEGKDHRRKKYGSRFNVWEYPIGYKYTSSDDIAFKHPAIFPEQLAEDHIVSWSNENDLVFDPFMGSGTTAKMAILTNRNFVGSDISSNYVALAEERIAKVVRGGRLPILKSEMEARMAEEELLVKEIEEGEKGADGKKWQPPTPKSRE